MLRHSLLALFTTLLLFCGAARADVAIPPLSGHVIDQIGILNESQQQSLNQVLQDYETRTGSQIAVLLMSTTAPEVIDAYSIRVADAWKLGRKGVDDGVILIVARDNPKELRRLRIEAGRGVQGVMTDVQSKRILADVIAPHFKQNDFYGGLTAGVTAIMQVLDKEALPAPVKKAQQEDDYSWVIPLIFFAFIFFSMMRRGSSAAYGRSSLPAIILGNAAGSWGRGGGGGGWGGGGSSGGGGFSGGGGGFDGGGASGDW